MELNKVNMRQEDRQVRIFNLPISVLTECKDKKVLLSVALSLFIKAHAGDSRFRGTQIRALKSFFGVGQARAEKIANTLKTNTKYFIYNPFKDTAVAKTFKNKTIVSYDKYGRKIWMMYAVKVKIDKSWSLKTLEKYLHDLLYLNAINATERSDKFCNGRLNKKGILLTTKDALTLSKMGHIGGVCKSTAKKHLARLAKDSVISINKGELRVVLCSVNEQNIKENDLENVRFIHDKTRNLGYIHTPNSYKITRRDITQSFRNIIFNSKRRHTYNAPTKNVDIMDTELMAMYR